MTRLPISREITKIRFSIGQRHLLYTPVRLWDFYGFLRFLGISISTIVELAIAAIESKDIAEDSNSDCPHGAIRVCAATSCIRDWNQKRSQSRSSLALSLLSPNPYLTISFLGEESQLTGKNKGERRNLKRRSGQNKSKASHTANTTIEHSCTPLSPSPARSLYPSHSHRQRGIYIHR